MLFFFFCLFIISSSCSFLNSTDVIGVNALHKLGVVLGVVTIALIIVHLMAYLKYKYDQKQEENALKGGLATAAYTAGTQEDVEAGEDGEMPEEHSGEHSVGDGGDETPVESAPREETQGAGDTKESTQSTIEMNSVSGAVPV